MWVRRNENILMRGMIKRNRGKTKLLRKVPRSQILILIDVRATRINIQRLHDRVQVLLLLRCQSLLRRRLRNGVRQRRLHLRKLHQILAITQPFRLRRDQDPASAAAAWASPRRSPRQTPSPSLPARSLQPQAPAARSVALSSPAAPSTAPTSRPAAVPHTPPAG